jgi:hypothetical protein
MDVSTSIPQHGAPRVHAPKAGLFVDLMLAGVVQLRVLESSDQVVELDTNDSPSPRKKRITTREPLLVIDPVLPDRFPVSGDWLD